MKIHSKSSPNITSGEMTGSVVGMSSKGLDMASWFLRDKIYSNKILACVREYICNAEDEHKKHGVKVPVDVKMVYDISDGKYYWSVRDYGKGLDENGIRNVFGMYFESTKSGDNQSIGGFGIGSKAGMSYSDSFYITSWNNGSKDFYVCSLGGGESGIPVGQIYDISKEPTTETGLEIRIEVKSQDVNSFHNITCNFVQSFSSVVGVNYVGHAGQDYTQFVPDNTTDLGNGVKLSMYKTFPNVSHDNRHVSIRMGGVVYHSQRFNAFLNATPIGRMVLDVPIGSLSIPISREAIESTPSNTKYLDELNKLLEKIVEADKANVKVPDFAEYIDNIGDYGNIKGEWVEMITRTTFPDLYIFGRLIGKTCWNLIPRDSNGKHIIYVLPNIKSTKKWQDRLELVLKTAPNYAGYFHTRRTDKVDEYIKSSNPELDFSNIVFADVKKLKLPPLPKTATSNVAYLVYKSCYKIGTMTPEELEEYALNKYGEVDLDDNWWESVDSLKILNARTIATRNETGTINREYCVANSSKIVADMLEMGWLSPSSQEYQTAFRRLKDEELRVQSLQNAEPTIKNKYFNTQVHPNLIKSVAKNIDKLDRLIVVKSRIMKEDSTRARILSKLSRGCHGHNDPILRSDLRKIMALK